MDKNVLILVRGLPGSGKSTFAAVISEKGKYPVFSIDSYFTDPHSGEYRFEFSNNHLAYKNCEAQTRTAMQNGAEKVIVDNTFTLEWEMEPYFKLAAEFGYTLFVLTMENRHGGSNVHNIGRGQLDKMAAKYKVALLPE